MRKRTAPSRRRSLPVPFGAALLVVSASVALPVARWGDSALVLLLFPAALVSYLVGRRMPALAPAVVTFVTVLLLNLLASFLVPGGAPLGDWMTSALIMLLAVVLPWWIGRYRLLLATQRESDATVVTERAQAAERARIADDLHDTIGHELALIAVQAGALELGRDLNPRQREQFQELRAAAVRASAHLREVVQLAEPDGPGRLEPRDTDGIEALIAGARDAGMAVAAQVDSDAVAKVHPLIGELALRTVREGLTNAARHAGGSAVAVVVASAAGGELAVTVRSGTPSAVGGPDASMTTPETAASTAGSGHGIRGLRRRAEALGAVLSAGPDADGFTLALRAPAGPTSAADTADAAVDDELRSNAEAARRGALQAAFVPMAIIALALTGFLIVQALTTTQTAISSSTFAQIELGQTRQALDDVLPAGIPSPAPVVVAPPIPDGTDCEYFAARDGWLHFTDATYRLCFADGVLVEKLLLEAS